MPINPGGFAPGLGGYSGHVKVARAEYWFSLDGGAISTISLRGDRIPPLATVVDSLITVTTACTSGGAATASLGIGSAATSVRIADVLATTPALGTLGTYRGALTAASTPVVNAGLSAMTLTIGTATLTNGRFTVLLSYIEA